ncbi:matrixin family metalloprotease [Parvularcula dongshanensis]|uniref:Ca2+-binding RTX toxin-like protein n=1 Tax=Parvularcula dongshanensis TaxID=1173995 RepID=A0A840HZ29_9PROT|nr:M10 family metallopeptidase C-terminal domain-containing protein [Parvularcula dongshanensis]MBB4657829.1 Ca2+-binding RTX toxin-like protein [Parvularcula dongshanensis]
MPTAVFRDDSGQDSAVLRGLTFLQVWERNDDNTPLHFTYHLSDSGVETWDPHEVAAMANAFETWSAVANIRFEEAVDEGGATFVESLYRADPTDLGFHELPYGSTSAQTFGQFNIAGEGWTAAGLKPGGYGFVTLLHELGHALGLEHPHDDDLFLGVTNDTDTGTFGLNQGLYTVMGYADGWWDQGEFLPREYGWNQSPMALDIAAIQAIYGANNSTRRGNDIYRLADSDAPAGSSGVATGYAAIWDAGGTDTIRYDGNKDAYVFLDDATIDDSPTGGGLLSYVEGIHGGFTIASGAIIENGATGGGNDVLVGNESANQLSAGSGNDIIYGLDGSDIIFGGDGDDIIVGDHESVTTFGAAFPRPTTYALPNGLAHGDGKVGITEVDGNRSAYSALDLSNQFAPSENPIIANGNLGYAVTVDARTDGVNLQYYLVTLEQDTVVTIDVDGAWKGYEGAGSFDCYIAIEDFAGNRIAFNDDGFVEDPGTNSLGPSSHNLDSFLTTILGAGDFYIIVGQYSYDEQYDQEPVQTESSYTLHVSVQPEVTASSLPAGDGLGMIGYYYETPDGWAEALA